METVYYTSVGWTGVYYYIRDCVYFSSSRRWLNGFLSRAPVARRRLTNHAQYSGAHKDRKFCNIGPEGGVDRISSPFFYNIPIHADLFLLLRLTYQRMFVAFHIR